VLEDPEKLWILLEDSEKLWVLLEDLKKLTNALIRQSAEFINFTACGTYNDHWALYA
jgi:hypothetical protein